MRTTKVIESTVIVSFVEFYFLADLEDLLSGVLFWEYFDYFVVLTTGNETRRGLVVTQTTYNS